jgi:hypothetical protein
VSKAAGDGGTTVDESLLNDEDDDDEVDPVDLPDDELDDDDDDVVVDRFEFVEFVDVVDVHDERNLAVLLLLHFLLLDFDVSLLFKIKSQLLLHAPPLLTPLVFDVSRGKSFPLNNFGRLIVVAKFELFALLLLLLFVAIRIF